MKVVEWIAYDDSDEIEVSFGGLGGVFKHGMRWKDYINNLSDHSKKYAEAIRKSVLENEIRIKGDDHQHGGSGVPVFDDGTCTSMSYRAWGDIMAAIWAEKEDTDYCYMDFYC